ncbi:MAG: hypothetical protein LBN08_01065 [Lactobacillales bacterium]|jgi:hypothetical protein|nr:hypothetical protein [Lactobacillales bacterium]
MGNLFEELAKEAGKLANGIANEADKLVKGVTQPRKNTDLVTFMEQNFDIRWRRLGREEELVGFFEGVWQKSAEEKACFIAMVVGNEMDAAWADANDGAPIFDDAGFKELLLEIVGDLNPKTIGKISNEDVANLIEEMIDGAKAQIPKPGGKLFALEDARAEFVEADEENNLILQSIVDEYYALGYNDAIDGVWTEVGEDLVDVFSYLQKEVYLIAFKDGRERRDPRNLLEL